MGSHSQADTEIGRNWGEGLPTKSSQLWLPIGDTWGGLRPLPKPRGLTWPRHPALKAPRVMG